MPRARTQTYHSQTAAAPHEGRGCLTIYVLSPLAVILISLVLAAFAYRQPLQIPGQVEVSYSLTTQRADLPDVSLSSIFTPEVQYWRASILRWASASGLDPNLAAVIMQIESCGHARARSTAGAMGLFQVMPFHFQAFDDPYNPDTNAQRGLAYLARSLEAAGGNARLALAGYNGGIGVIARPEATWSDQTRRYVYYGAPIYDDARNGAPVSALLDEWHAKYGAGLCRQARASQ
jgi:soluble lytic murein transglycosylase-like protein